MSQNGKSTIHVKKSRLLIYSIYSPDGVDTGYRYYFLSKVRRLFDKIIVVVNGDLVDNTKEKISNMSNEIIIRENKGFDACAYQYVLRDKLQYNLSDYEELFLVNDTFYGPFFDLEKIFYKAEKNGADLWGMTFFQKGTDGNAPAEVQYSHIQSYFLCFTSHIFHSEVFKEFWNNVECYRDVKDVVKNYESELTHYFEINMGARCWTYINSQNFPVFIDQNIYLTHSYDLLKDHNFPFLKKKSIITEYISNPKQVYDLFLNFERFNYPINLIYQEMEKENGLSLAGWLYDFRNLREIVLHSKRILLYGAGQIGKTLGYYLKFKNIENYIYIVSDGQTIDQPGVIKFSNYIYLDGDFVIIAVMRRTVADLMYESIITKVPKENVLRPCCIKN